MKMIIDIKEGIFYTKKIHLEFLDFDGLEKEVVGLLGEIKKKGWL